MSRPRTKRLVPAKGFAHAKGLALCSAVLLLSIATASSAELPLTRVILSNSGLAQFIHESTAGTQGVARVTKSVGNIRVTPGYQDYQGFRKYDTWEQGIEDWYQLIRDLYIGEWGLTTVDQIIPVYAPTSDGNNVDNYVSTIKRLVSSWR